MLFLVEKKLSAGRVNLVGTDSGGLANTFLDLYDIEWTCDRSHIFGKNQIAAPTKCTVCGSLLCKSVIVRKGQPVIVAVRKFQLSSLEREALARIS